MDRRMGGFRDGCKGEGLGMDVGGSKGLSSCAEVRVREGGSMGLSSCAEVMV